jgi:hypothetical protein
MAVLTRHFRSVGCATSSSSYIPAECEEMGPRGVSRLISGGLARATALGFEAKDYLSFLAMEICFGQKFARKIGP